jgi:REP-associated tyrosine transposase
LSNYVRYRVPGGCYFFTVNLLERFPNDTLIRHIDILRAVAREVRGRWPFAIDGWVVLPDHMHCIWTLPPGDDDFTNRWRLIKAGFARRLPKVERRSAVRRARGERGVWQRRFWEHAIRDERDFANHMDYLRFNPVKHGHVRRVADWPHSSFARCVERGVYPADWAADDPVGEFGFGERE